MIGYPISRAQLEELLRAESDTWLDRAKERTEGFRTLGRYAEKGSIWSEVKVVYMRLQGGAKCAYCERKLEAEEAGKGEQAVEHFRPKGKVRSWKVPSHLGKSGVIVAKAPVEKYGYYLLPYHPFNYAAACHPCNSALKGNLFPIAGAYDLVGEDPATLKSGELPLLIYPLGDCDDAPENLIRFHGASPQPVAVAGHDRQRALATIELLRLDSRKNLLLERQRVLVLLYPQLDILSDETSSATRRQAARQIVEGAMRSTSQHANCARSFVDLFKRDPQKAEALFLEAAERIENSS